MSKKNLVVLCNAKSLSEYPFYNYRVDTIGMNIAYRFWHQIGWYPTYYVSLDKNVNLNYAKDLYFLVANRKRFGIKKFLFRKIILEAYPELKNIAEVSFLEHINKKSNKAFRGNTQITTGSFGVRWGVSLGYRKIYILGVDSFVPLPKDIKNIVDANGILTHTLSPDLNKFFDGYQKKGDILHVSTKENTNRNNGHTETFRSIYNDINKKKIAKIVVSNYSKLLKKIFPYKAIPDDFLKPPDQWITIDWEEVLQGIEDDRPPKITPEIEFNVLLDPSHVI